VVRPAPGALFDRLLRGRLWLGCVAVLLVGVVFSNVALLELNRGITTSSEKATKLKRDNAQLRVQLGTLGSSERIQEAAAERGLVLPAPGEVRYLRAGTADGRQAAQRLAAAGAPDGAPAIPAPGSSVTPVATPSPAPAATSSPVAQPVPSAPVQPAPAALAAPPVAATPTP